MAHSIVTDGSDNPGVLLDFGDGCTSGDFLSVQTKFAKQFDMSHYPFEAHTLKIRLKAPFTSESQTPFDLSAKPAEPPRGVTRRLLRAAQTALSSLSPWAQRRRGAAMGYRARGASTVIGRARAKRSPTTSSLDAAAGR